MIIYRKEIFVIFLHIFDVYEITLGTRNPFHLFKTLNLFLVWVTSEAVEKTHFEIIPHDIDDTLNLFVHFIIFHDDIVLKYDSVLEPLFETSPVKLHVSHVTPDGPHVKMCHIGS